MITLLFVYRHSTITRPLDGRLSRGKVLLMIAFVWIYATPWALLPLLKIWGRFVPGMYENYLKSVFYSTDTCLIYNVKCYFNFFRGISNIVHLRLFDKYFRHKTIRSLYLCLQLCIPNVFDHLLLQWNCETSIRS